MSADQARFGLDTNILIYAVDARDASKTVRAGMIISRAAETRRCVLTLQNIGEFYHAVSRKRLGRPEQAARRAIRFMQLFPLAEARADDVKLAVNEAAAGRYSYWDALLLLTLARAGCSVLLSEDMHDGNSLAGVMVRNPFVGDELPAEIAGLLSRPR